MFTDQMLQTIINLCADGMATLQSTDERYEVLLETRISAKRELTTRRLRNATRIGGNPFEVAELMSAHQE